VGFLATVYSTMAPLPDLLLPRPSIFDYLTSRQVV